jgi:hypothetical protein
VLGSRAFVLVDRNLSSISDRRVLLASPRYVFLLLVLRASRDELLELCTSRRELVKFLADGYVDMAFFWS